MSENNEQLLFSAAPEIVFATNRFINVPVILQYDETPLIEVVNEVQAGYTTKFSIYHNDGTYLAKVVGSRLFSTPDGVKAGLQLSFPDLMTVCKMENRTLFEIRRRESAALATEAELFTPDGSFIRSRGPEFSGSILKMKDQPLSVGRLTLFECTLSGCPIGIHVRSNGTTGVGVSQSK